MKTYYVKEVFTLIALTLLFIGSILLYNSITASNLTSFDTGFTQGGLSIHSAQGQLPDGYKPDNPDNNPKVLAALDEGKAKIGTMLQFLGSLILIGIEGMGIYIKKNKKLT